MGSFYTGRGDNGETDTMGFGRMGKESPLANALGDVDELNSLIGVAIANTPDKHLCDVMIGIQNKLFTIGAQLSAAPGSTLKSNAKITGSDIKDLEDEIDENKIRGGKKPLQSPLLSVYYMLTHIAPRYVRTNPSTAHKNEALPDIRTKIAMPPMFVNFQRTGCFPLVLSIPAMPLIPLKNRVIALITATAATMGVQNVA